MKQYKLKDFKKGWICGLFEPSLLKTKKFELAVKFYKKNDYDTFHYHKKAIEYTIIISGKVSMNNNIYKKGDVIVIDKKESTDFLALTNAVTVVLKVPGYPKDKYHADYIKNI
jgi:hypothetical protein